MVYDYVATRLRKYILKIVSLDMCAIKIDTIFILPIYVSIQVDLLLLESTCICVL